MKIKLKAYMLGYQRHLYLIMRHGAISISCATTEFVLFMLLYTVYRESLTFSYAASFFCATTIGYIGHSLFTFKIGYFSKRNAFFFLIQSLLGLALGYNLILVFIKLGLVTHLAKALQLIMVFFFNVSYGKLISFKN